MSRYTPEQTHKIMSSVRSKDTNIEIKLRKALWHRGYRYRKNFSYLPGKPDIVFPQFKLAIFCDAEFWHGKDWEVLQPKLEKGKNSDFWIRKIEKNRNRDLECNKKLVYLGWTVLRFWGKDILSNTEYCIKVIEETIHDIIFSRYKLDMLESDYTLR